MTIRMGSKLVNRVRKSLNTLYCVTFRLDWNKLLTKVVGPLWLDGPIVQYILLPDDLNDVVLH